MIYDVCALFSHFLLTVLHLGRTISIAKVLVEPKFLNVLIPALAHACYGLDAGAEFLESLFFMGRLDVNTELGEDFHPGVSVIKRKSVIQELLDEYGSEEYARGYIEVHQEVSCTRLDSVIVTPNDLQRPRNPCGAAVVVPQCAASTFDKELVRGQAQGILVEAIGHEDIEAPLE